MRLAVVGSRDLARLDLVERYLNEHEGALDVVVSGGARGVDRTAETWAADHGVPVMSFRPVNLGEGDRSWAVERWMGGQRSVLPGRYRGFAPAAFVRNGYIVEAADRVVAFWDGASNGTHHTINRARADGKLLEVVWV